MRTMTSSTNCSQMLRGDALHCRAYMDHGIRGYQPLPTERFSTSPERAPSTRADTSICGTIARSATGGALRIAYITINTITMALIFTIILTQEDLLGYRTRILPTANGGVMK